MFKGYVNITIRNIDWNSSTALYLENDIAWQGEGHINARCLDFYYFIEAHLEIFVDSLEFNLGVEDNEFCDLTKVEKCKLFTALKSVVYHNIVECKHLSGKEQVKLADTFTSYWHSKLTSLSRRLKIDFVTNQHLLEFDQITDYIKQYAEQVEQQLK